MLVPEEKAVIWFKTSIKIKVVLVSNLLPNIKDPQPSMNSIKALDKNLCTSFIFYL